MTDRESEAGLTLSPSGGALQTPLTASGRSQVPLAEQRMDALRTANVIRSRRAELKRSIQHGHLHVTDVLADPPTFAEQMPVASLVAAVPKIGPAALRRILRDVRYGKTVGGLTPMQRQALIERLGSR